MMATAMISSMPGGWPRTSMEQEQVVSRLQVPRINTQIRQPSRRAPSPPSASSSSSRSGDELFFEAPQSMTSSTTSEISTPSHLVFEPVVESVESDNSVDWWRYGPPSELFRVQEGTSEELRGVIPRSVERLRTQQAEEEERRAATAREVRPLARRPRKPVPTRPRRNALTMITNSDPLAETLDRDDASNHSATSLISDDSGYGSTAPESSTASTPPESTSITASKGKQKGVFSFSSIFRKKDNTTSHLDLRHYHSSRPSSSHSSVSPIQIPSSPVPAISISDSSTTECVSCLDDYESGDMIKLTCHSYCKECFQRLISTALETEAQWPAKCCLNPIPSETILPKLNDATREKYRQREAEWSIPASDRVYCSHAGCNVWIPPRRINAANNVARCKQCSHKTCTLCRGESHHGMDCPQDPALQQTMDLAELEGWKRCYQCNAYVEHNKGCRHMTCRCKAEFCYICSARWRTCSCTDAQLITAQQAASARRQERTNQERATAAEIARREAAAEEERIILQMVADFEREEAEREAAAFEAQRLRDEQARLQREEETRLAEERRIAGIGARFRQLSMELESLTEIQHVLMAERYEFENEVQRKERQDALDALHIRQSSETEKLITESKKMMTEAEYAYKQEYHTRLAEEQRIEKQYVDELRLFWEGKEDGEAKVWNAREELRLEQDKEYKFWDAYRRKQLFAIQEGEKRKMETLLVKHVNEVKVAEGRAKIDVVEWKRKVWAEGKWVEAVTRERSSMLAEMEMVEYARV